MKLTEWLFEDFAYSEFHDRFRIISFFVILACLIPFAILDLIFAVLKEITLFTCFLISTVLKYTKAAGLKLFRLD